MTETPSEGNWRGFYMWNGEKHYFTMSLTFYESGYLLGFCEDDEDFCGEIADIRGKWWSISGEDNNDEDRKFKVS